MPADPRVVAAVDAQSSVLVAITQALIDFIGALFGLIDPYSPADVDRFVTEAEGAVKRARRQAVAVTDQYMKSTFLLVDVPIGGEVPLPGKEIGGIIPVPEQPRGIPFTEEWVRPVKEYRRLRLNGLDDLNARLKAMERAERMAWADVNTAVRDTEAHRLQTAEGVIGWRRIIHPEVAAIPGRPPGPVCGLCLVAADRVYSVETLKPLHSLCRCTVLPVTEAGDPGLNLSQDTLGLIYQAAGGSTFAEDLARVRFRIEQHAELGPTLVDVRHQWRGPVQVGKDAPDLAEALQRDLADLTERLKVLEEQAAAGEDVAGPLQWQRQRVEAVRDLIDAA